MVLRALDSKASIYKLATIGLTGNPMAASSICSQNGPWNPKYVLFRQNPSSCMMFCTDIIVLCGIFMSCSSFCLIISMAGSTGTEVNSALT